MATLVVLYLLGPLALEFTAYGFLGYRAAPNQIIRPEAHEVVQSTRVCKADDCESVPDVWRDRRTGTIYRRSDFIDHRRGQAQRLGWTWFAYGLLGCSGAALAAGRYDARRLPRIAMASLAVAVLISAMVYLELNP